MYPSDVQVVADNLFPPMWEWWLEFFWDDTVVSGETGFGDFDCNRAVILCHPDTSLHPPACFLAKFPGGGADVSTGPLRLTGSGRISENVFTTEPNRYEDEPVLVYTKDGIATLMLAQELQSTGDDVFAVMLRTGLQPAPGGDVHRLEAVEPFLRRGAGVHPGTQEITLAPVTSYILDEITGTPGTGFLVPALNDTVQPVKVPIGVIQRARWLGFVLFGGNANCVFRYLGAILRGRRVS